MAIERVKAINIEPGDRIARTRLETPRRVTIVRHHAKSVGIVFEGSGGRIRPQHKKLFWRHTGITT